MRATLDWTASATLPTRSATLALQGIPPDASVPGRIEAVAERAEAEYLALAEPRAVIEEVNRVEFAAVFRGDGQNAPETPLDGIYPKAHRLALFAATTGKRLSIRIGALFGQRELAVAWMLDATASAAADRLADLSGERYASLTAGDAGSNQSTVLAYSPGYCGWHVSGQRALFACLHPEQIGITLNSSCLMRPLKSVSGVLVAGTPDIHRFRPTYPFCADCRDKPCRDRMRDALHA